MLSTQTRKISKPILTLGVSVLLLGGLMAMRSCTRSLPLSPGTLDAGSVAKTRSGLPFIIRNNVDEPGSTSKRSCAVGPKPNLSSTTTGRREAIRMGLGLVELIAWQFPWQSQIAGAAETAPCELTVAPSGLAYCDKVVGTGPGAVKGQLIKAHYVGKLENGKVFDSSYSRGKPLTFKVGVGEVIKGWDEGILGGDGVPPMLAGGKRILKLPPELGYGMRGAGCKGGSCIIPPESVLLFDVEFIGKA